MVRSHAAVTVNGAWPPWTRSSTSLPISAFITPRSSPARAGRRESGGRNRLKIPAPRAPRPPQGRGDPGAGASLGTGVRSGLEYLQGYDYECTEQTVSRFRPNAVSYGVQGAWHRRPALKAGWESCLGSGCRGCMLACGLTAAGLVGEGDPATGSIGVRRPGMIEAQERATASIQRVPPPCDG
jgi:hypothetical protein